MISVGASDPNGTEIREFHGKSAIGCISDGADLTLVRSPGGPLGTLLIVIGKRDSPCVDIVSIEGSSDRQL